MALDGGSIKKADSRSQLFLSLCSVASGLEKLMLTIEPDFFLCQRLLISTHLCGDLFHVPPPLWMTWWDTEVYLQGITPLELSKLTIYNFSGCEKFQTILKFQIKIYKQQIGTQALGCTPVYGLYGDVPLDRVWFLSSLS